MERVDIDCYQKVHFLKGEIVTFGSTASHQLQICSKNTTGKFNKDFTLVIYSPEENRFGTVAVEFSTAVNYTNKMLTFWC